MLLVSDLTPQRPVTREVSVAPFGRDDRVGRLFGAVRRHAQSGGNVPDAPTIVRRPQSLTERAS